MSIKIRKQKSLGTHDGLKEISLLDQKAEQINIFLIISALIFGFTVTIIFLYDEQLFVEENKTIELIFFVSSLTISIVGSLWSTITCAGSLVMLRKYLHRNQPKIVKQLIQKTIPIREYNQWFCYIAYFSLIISLIIYSFIKLKSINLKISPVISAIILSCGAFGMCVIYFEIRKIYAFFDQRDH